MPIAETTLLWIEIGLFVPLATLGLHRGWMALRSRWPAELPDDDFENASVPGNAPRVTVQLPLYNEHYVAERLLRAVSALDYPRNRLQVQVLDDSTDDTSAIIARFLESLPEDLDVQHLRRGGREGFKAGALAHGLETATGEFIAVFDADFTPDPDFLRRTLPSFSGPEIGMVQTRWEHLNPEFSLLTRMQATLLDGHFIVEHIARAQSGCFFNFNGTAGVFRRSCIEDAGGWQRDTLTEDMDLSYRAQLRGWKFAYLPRVTCPAELPVEMPAFLNQQHRWAKGSIQTARKLLRSIWRAPISMLTKVEAGFHLLGNLAFPLLVILILVALPLQLLRVASNEQVEPLIGWLEGLPLLLATLCVMTFYGVAQARVGRLGMGSALRLPLVIALGAGLSVNNTAAVLSGLRKRTGDFRRTPKHNVIHHDFPELDVVYRSPRGFLPLLEVALGLCAATTSVLASSLGLWGTTVFHGLFACGLLVVGCRSVLDDLRRPAAAVTAA